MKIHNDHRLDASFKHCFLQGVCTSSMTGFVQEYLTPFLLFLGGTAKHVSMLSAFPNLVASLLQLKSADIADKIKSRKKVVAIFVLLQALVLLALSLIAFFDRTSATVFIIMVVFFTSFGALVNPSWGSLLSDLLPVDKRGEYCGWMNKHFGFITLSTTFLAGLILHYLELINIKYGFFVIFMLAFIVRMFSLYFLEKIEEPHLSYSKENHFTFIAFLSRLKGSNFARFVVFVATMNFCVNMAAPFFAVLMLRDLSFSYFLYTTLQVTVSLTVYLVIRRWGRHADKIGNLKVIKFTAPLIGIIPLFWIVNREPWCLFCAQIFSGFVWAGFNLSSTNFIYDAVTPGKRTRCIAYFNVVNGLALSFGAVLGGIILPKLPPLFGNKILMMLLISSILRIVVGLIMPVGLKEVRPVEKLSNRQLFFSMIGIKPLLGIERKTIRF